MSETYILAGTTPVPEADLQAWARWFETADRRVAETWVTPAIRVSTVFLGLDHQWGVGPPLLFETMVFREGDGQDTVRTSTWHQAEQAHEQVVELVRTRWRGGRHA